MKNRKSISDYSHISPNLNLWILLTHTRDTMFRAREVELRRYRLSPEESATLFLVQNLGVKATPAEISRGILRQPHTVSAIISRMEKKGLVQKVKDLKYKNMIRVTLTEKGQKAYKYTTRSAPINRIVEALTRDEQKQFQKLTRKLLAAAREELGLDKEEELIEY